MRVWRLTDDEYIGRVRRFHRNRRIWGCVLLVFPVICIILPMWLYKNMIQQVFELLDSFTEVNSAATVDLAIAVDKLRFFVGFKFGMMAGVGMICGLEAVCTGFKMLLFRDRKTQMLLDCLDQQGNAPDNRMKPTA